MEKIGIICEYNPFHNGHLYHIEEIKKMYPDCLIVLVLGGYFLERGDISLISKWDKTRIALDYGVDIVMELPTLYNTNSADIFALKAVQILNRLKVDKLVFGSESGDIEHLIEIAERQDSVDFNRSVKNYLKLGFNYPTSLSKALEASPESNDILGIAYIKAIKKLKSSIEPVAIKRTNSFLDTERDDRIVSATNIRLKLQEGKSIEKHIPQYDINVIKDINFSKLFELIKYRIKTESHLDKFLGVDEGFENRLKSVINEVDNIESLLKRLSTKRYTISKIKRTLLHVLLGIEKSDINLVRSTERILGFDSRGREYLKNFSKTQVSSKVEDEVSEIELRASYVYEILGNSDTTREEVLNKPVIRDN